MGALRNLEIQRKKNQLDLLSKSVAALLSTRQNSSSDRCVPRGLGSRAQFKRDLGKEDAGSTSSAELFISPIAATYA